MSIEEQLWEIVKSLQEIERMQQEITSAQQRIAVLQRELSAKTQKLSMGVVTLFSAVAGSTALELGDDLSAVGDSGATSGPDANDEPNITSSFDRDLRLFGMSAKAENLLQQVGVETFADVVTICERGELQLIRQMGERTIAEIVRSVESYTGVDYSDIYRHGVRNKRLKALHYRFER